jgi:hypothetical protein
MKDEKRRGESEKRLARRSNESHRTVAFFIGCIIKSTMLSVWIIKYYC